MHRGLRVAAVLPAYNEENYIGAAVRFVRASVFDDVIVVDDASLDLTRARAEDAGASIVITHPVNGGVGAALITGFKAAVERGNDVAVVIPGDGQADLTALPAMLDKIAEGYGLVISDRLTGRDATEWGMPKYRLFGSRVLSWMTYLSTGLRIPDPQSGYKAIRRETLERLPLDDLYPRWGFHNDVLSHCALLRIPVTTVPAEPVYTDLNGDPITSHIKLWDLIPRHLKLFVRFSGRRMRHAVTGRHGSPPWDVTPAADEELDPSASQEAEVVVEHTTPGR